MNIQTKLDKLIADQQALQRVFQTTAQKMFKTVTKEFFDKNPAITMITWNQYTPYFNDGEECVFGVHEPRFTNCPLDEIADINKWGEYDGENEKVWCITDPAWILKSDNKYYDTEKAALNALASAKELDIDSIQSFHSMVQTSEMEDVFRVMFGDHVTIIATREGFEVKDLEHD